MIVERHCVRSSATESDPFTMFIRPITPKDAPLYRDVLERTSEEDRYCRFFHVVNHFDLDEVAKFIDDRPDAIGLIAEDETRPLGVAHAFFAAGGPAEIAVVVASDVRRRGVGRALLKRLIELMHARKCFDVLAYSLSGNSAFAHLGRSLGMTPIGPPGEMMTWRLAELPATREPR